MALSSEMGKLFLNKEVSVDDLNKGVEFEVDCDDHCSDTEDETNFEDEHFQTFKEEFFEDKPFSGDVSFAELKEIMEPLTEDKKILKEVISDGVGVVIPDKSVVRMHYEAYLENKKEPFDSTRLRRKVYKFVLGEENLVPGLELGIRTMKKDEISRFLVSPDYAYGSMGCPPRIPPSAEILYEVQILDVYPTKDAIEYEDMTPEERKRASFEKIVSVYQCENRVANDLFHRKLYYPAIVRYRRVANMLEEVSVTDAIDDRRRNGYLLKLYLNLSQCFLNIQEPMKALMYANLALKIDSDNPKALYRIGYAYYLMTDYVKAEYYLTKAKEFLPHEKKINEALIKLENKRKQYITWKKLFCKRMLGSNYCNSEKEDLEETPEFVSAVEEQILRFVNSIKKEMTFSSSYTAHQLEVVQLVAEKFNLAFVSKIVEDLKINKVVKRNGKAYRSNKS